jgi:hypothetical protein
MVIVAMVDLMAVAIEVVTEAEIAVEIEVAIVVMHQDTLAKANLMVTEKVVAVAVVRKDISLIEFIPYTMPCNFLQGIFVLERLHEPYINVVFFSFNRVNKQLIALSTGVSAVFGVETVFMQWAYQFASSIQPPITHRRTRMWTQCTKRTQLLAFF